MKGVVIISTDGRGNYQRDLGQKEETGTKQHRFYLGKDFTAAQIRFFKLDHVWAAVEKRWQRSKYTSRPVWDSVGLAIGKAVAAGLEDVDIDPTEHQIAIYDGTEKVFVKLMPFYQHSPEDLLPWFAQLQEDFPFVRLRQVGDWPPEAVARTKAKAANYRKLAEQAEQVISAGQTLHQALDAFSDWIQTTYQTPKQQTTAHGIVCQKQVALIREHAKDVALEGFDLNEIEGLITQWKNRPLSKRGKPVSSETSKNIIKRLRQFVKWLHKNPDFDWRKPEDYEVEPVRIGVTSAEKAKKHSPVQIDTFTVAELATLWAYATPRERIYLALALNCGFGQAELGTLQIAELYLNQAHDHYPVQGSFIKKVRFKNDVYGEWQLWPETEIAVKWYQAQRPATKETALLVTKEGNLLTTPTKGNNRNGRLPAAFEALLKRIRKDQPEFRKLSFNKLRKTAGNLVRQESDGETAAVFLCHGQPGSDSLLEVYTNRQFTKVFTALNKVRETLAPMFARISDPFPTDGKRRNPSLSLAVREKIVHLRRQGKEYKAIATECGVSIATVLKYLTAAGLVRSRKQERKVSGPEYPGR